MLKVLRLSHVLILQKLLQMVSFVHNFTDTSNTAHVSESACAALDREKRVRKTLCSALKVSCLYSKKGFCFSLTKKVLLKLSDQRIWPSSTVCVVC